MEDPNLLGQAFKAAQALIEEYRVPVVVEVILERVTNISMAAAEIDSVNEFEELAVTEADAPSSNLTALV